MQTHLQNPFDYFDRIYLINLRSRPDRLEQAKDEFSKVGISDFKLIDGVVHENPAHGCHLSHAKCLADALIYNLDKVLIFEDDIEFFPNAVSNLKSALKELPSDWDMFYLGANLDRFPAYELSDHIAKLTGAYATHAYAIRYNMFEYLYGINSSEKTVHNDVVYSEIVHPDYDCFLAMPLIAGQRDSYSDIQRTFMSSNKMFQERLVRNLVRKK